MVGSDERVSVPPRAGPRGGSPAAPWPWRPALTVLLALALPLIFAMQPGVQQVDLTFALQFGLCAYTGYRLASVVARPHISPLQGMFWLFCYVAMGIAPLAQLVVGQTPIPVTGAPSDLLRAVLLTFAGCIAFDIGAHASAHRWVASLGRTLRHPPAPRLVPVPPWRVAVLTAVAFLATAALVAQLGLGTLFSSRQAIKSDLAQAGLSTDSHVGSATLLGLGTVPILVAFLLFTRRLVVDPASRRRPGVLLVWGATAGAQVLVNNPISNPRFWFVTVALSTVLVVSPRHLAAFRVALVVGVVASLLLFPFADRFRYEDGPTGRYAHSSPIETLATKDYDQMSMVANTVTFVNDGPGHTSGAQTLGALLFWLPRAVWESKPSDTGTTVGLWIGTENVNLSEPLWSELWIDFGAGGMLLGFLGLGYVFRRTDGWYADATERAGPTTSIGMIAVPVLAGYEFILLRGSLLQAMGRLGIMVLCFVALSAWAGPRAPRRAGSDPGAGQGSAQRGLYPVGE